MPPSNVDNVIIIDDDDVADTADGISKVQECKLEKMEEFNPGPAAVPGNSETQNDCIPGTPETQNNQISAGPNGGL